VSDEITALATTEEPTPEAPADEKAGKEAAERLARRRRCAIRKLFLSGDTQYLPNWEKRYGIKVDAHALCELLDKYDVGGDEGKQMYSEIAEIVGLVGADGHLILNGVKTAALIERDRYARKTGRNAVGGPVRIPIIDKDTTAKLAEAARVIEAIVGMAPPPQKVQEAEFEVNGEEEPAHADAGRT